MKRIFIVSAGFILVVAALTFTLRRREASGEPQVHVEASAKRSLSESRRVKAELAGLRAELRRLERASRPSANPAVPAEAEAGGPPSSIAGEHPPAMVYIDPEQAMEAERNRADEVMENFEDILDSEPRDAAWADEAEYQITHALDELDTGSRAQVVDTKCGSTLCVAEFEFADRDAAEALRHHISIGEEFGFTRRSSEPGETPLRQTFVLARPGHELPMPS